MFADPGARQLGAVSAYYGEVCAAALARWLDTYLLPEEPGVPPALALAFGPHREGPAALALAVGLVGQALTQWPGEPVLHRVVCGALLPALTRRPGLCAHLVATPAWGEVRCPPFPPGGLRLTPSVTPAL